VKRIIVLLIMILILTPISIVFAENVAVLDFVSKGGVSAGDASAITDFFRSDLVSAGTFQVLDRKNIESILKEQEFQSGGFTDTEYAVKIGRLLNVESMFVGTITLFAGKYVLTIDRIRIETGRIDDSYKETTDKLDDLLRIEKDIAYKLSNKDIASGKTGTTEKQGEKILFKSNYSSGQLVGFTQISGDWIPKNNELTVTGYKGDQATIFFGDVNWTDYTFSTDVRAKPNSAFGILLRVQNYTRYIYLVIFPGGHSIYWHINGSEAKYGLPLIEPEDKTMHIEVDVVGDEYTVWINNHLKTVMKDSSNKNGRVGIITNFTYETPIVWGEMLVTTPKKR
jgi:hypothetical protein